MTISLEYTKSMKKVTKMKLLWGSLEGGKKINYKNIKILYFMIRKQWAVTENFASCITFIGKDLDHKDIEMYLKTCHKNNTLSNVSEENLTAAISIFL